MFVKNCKQCGKIFSAPLDKQLYCCVPCQKKHTKEAAKIRRDQGYEIVNTEYTDSLKTWCRYRQTWKKNGISNVKKFIEYIKLCLKSLPL